MRSDPKLTFICLNVDFFEVKFYQLFPTTFFVKSANRQYLAGLILTNYCVQCHFRDITCLILLKTKKTCRLGGCSVLNAINLEKRRVKIHKYVLLLDFLALFWLYRTHVLIFQNQHCLVKQTSMSLYFYFKNSFEKLQQVKVGSKSKNYYRH